MAEGKYTQETVKMTDQQQKAQRSRNIAIALVLAVIIALLYWVTWAKLGANILQRPI